jgi:antitoxin component YwqK of YwqJK toxin-antitoxin module
MTNKLILILFLLQTGYFAQSDSTGKAYYKNGNLKLLANWKGKDTVQFIKYYKNGRIKDSVWVYIPKGEEIPFGTGKKYYESGTLRSIYYFKNGLDEYVSYEYHENGLLKHFEQKPTGLTKNYNKKGEQVYEIDQHKSKQVFVPKNFRKGRHLKNLNYDTRIKTKKAWLVNGEKKHKLSTGVLVSLNLSKDTSLLSHCQIEGFSNDSIYFSRFHYNENYRITDGAILKFDSTFALGVNQLDTIYYSKHRNRKRTFGATFAYISGVALVVFPVAMVVIFPIMGVTITETLAMYSIFAVPGAGLYFLGKHLFNTTVPKKYDMHKYKILVKT